MTWVVLFPENEMAVVGLSQHWQVPFTPLGLSSVALVSGATTVLPSVRHWNGDVWEEFCQDDGYPSTSSTLLSDADSPCSLPRMERSVDGTPINNIHLVSDVASEICYWVIPCGFCCFRKVNEDRSPSAGQCVTCYHSSPLIKGGNKRPSMNAGCAPSLLGITRTLTVLP